MAFGDICADLIPTGPAPTDCPMPAASVEAMDYQTALGGIDLGKFVSRILTPSSRQLQLVHEAAPIIGSLATAGVFSSNNQKQTAGGGYQYANQQVPGLVDPALLAKKDNTGTILLVGGVAVVGILAAILLSR